VIGTYVLEVENQALKTWWFKIGIHTFKSSILFDFPFPA